MVSTRYTTLFLDAIKDNHIFEEARDVVRMNSMGTLYLIGGFVFRNIARALYGTSLGDYDFDFIVPRLHDELVVPKGWSLQRNSFGNPKFIKGDIEVDCVPLNNVHWIERNGLEEKIENFLSGVPLTVQSIAYDLARKEVFGDVGIDAIRKRTVAVHSIPEAKNYCKLKGISVDELVTQKARSLKFVAHL